MNYANQERIYLTNLDKIKHAAGIQQQFLPALDWNKLLMVQSDLTGNEFKVYLYLFKWAGSRNDNDKTKPGYYEFSPADIEIQLDMSTKTAQTIKKSLLSKGYLERVSENTFNFNPYPNNLNDRYEKQIQERKERRLIRGK